MRIFRWLNILLLFYSTTKTAITKAIVLTTVKNLRSIVPGLIYRSASLDELSQDDAQLVLSGEALNSTLPLAAVIDLRNQDEIEKGQRVHTDGSRFFYKSLKNQKDSSILLHIPTLRDIDGFWEEAITRMDPIERVKAIAQTVVQGGALDRAAARNLERGGLSMLYTIMLATSSEPLSLALQACLEESARGPVIFHCQKGKDRTGILAMLIQTCLDQNEEDIIEAYALSGGLLEEKEEDKKDSKGGTIDWSYFRGSPAVAMKKTLDWIHQRYGSVDEYLDSISFDDQKRKAVKDRCQK